MKEEINSQKLSWDVPKVKGRTTVGTAEEACFGCSGIISQCGLLLVLVEYTESLLFLNLVQRGCLVNENDQGIRCYVQYWK